MVFTSDCPCFLGYQTSEPMSASSDRTSKNARQNRDYLAIHMLQIYDAYGIKITRSGKLNLFDNLWNDSVALPSEWISIFLVKHDPVRVECM